MRQEMMRFRDGSGISWTICKQSAPHSRQITTPTPHHSIFTGQTNNVKEMKNTNYGKQVGEWLQWHTCMHTPTLQVDMDGQVENNATADHPTGHYRYENKPAMALLNR